MRIILLAGLLLALSTGASFAQRIYCPIPEHGIWVNPDTEPKEISRIEVESRCANNQVYVRVRAFTSCSPRDCKWGWTEGAMRSDGAVQALLVGFLSSKQLTLKAFGDLLDTQVTNIVNDQSVAPVKKTHNLQRK